MIFRVRERKKEKKRERKKDRKKDRKKARKKERKKNSRKSITWSAVPVAPAFTFFWLREGKLGQRPRRGR